MSDTAGTRSAATTAAASASSRPGPYRPRITASRQYTRRLWGHHHFTSALAMQTLFNSGLALALALARIGARTTDFAQVLPFVLRTWMYVSGIFYDPARIAAGAPHPVRPLLDANPALTYVSLMRFALIDSVTPGRPPPHVWPLAVIWATVSGGAGYAFFKSSEEEYGRG